MPPVDTPEQYDPWQTPPPAADASTDAQHGPPMQPQTIARLIIAWVCIVICTLALFVLQSFGMKMVQQAYAEDTRPGFGAIYIARYATGVENLFNGQGSQMMLQFDDINRQSLHPVSGETRAVILAGEIAPGTLESRLDYLGDLKREAQTDAREDADLIYQIYAEGYTPSAAERDGLVERHGWFGEIAATYNLPNNHADYRSPRRSATIVVLSLFGFVFTVILAGITGFVLAIIAIVLLCRRKLVPRLATGPAGHRTAYLEMVALFLLVFIGVQLVFGVIQELTGVNLMLPILLASALPLLWPVLVGVPWKRYKQDMGFHRGRGVFHEIAAGFVGYLAGLPIIAVGILITFVLSFFAEVQADHPMQYELLDGGTYTIFLTLAAAVIWAPLVEESVFRSGFYRHLRQRPGADGFLLATGLTAFIFAAIHPQGWVGIPALMSIAFVLSGLREWRGSIVPSMVAHAVHNGALCLIFGIVLFA